MNIASVRRRWTLHAALAGGLAIAAAVSGCGGGGASSSRASVRAINLNVEAATPAVDVYAGDARQFESLGRGVLSDSARLDPGTYAINVRAVGSASTLATSSATVAKDKHYTAVIWGRDGALRVTTLTEDESSGAVAAGNARLRVLNATTDNGAVDVYLTGTTADLGGSVALHAAVASNGTVSEYRDVGRGTYRLRVTGAADPDDVRLDIPAVTLEDKTFTTLVVTASPGGVLVNGALIGQQAGAALLPNTQARVRVAASVPAAGSVAATVGAQAIAVGLVSPAVGPYVRIDAGTRNLTLRVNNAVVSDAPHSFAAGADYTLLVMGAVPGTQVLIADDNRLPNAATRARIRLVNGVFGAAAQTLSLDFQPLGVSVASGTASPTYAAVNATTVGTASRLDVFAVDATDPLFTTIAATNAALLQGQRVYTVFTLGGRASPTGVLRLDR